MTERRVSAWTKSIPSSALIGSAMSHPNRYGTWGDSLLATSAPNGLDTPVTSTRLGVIDFFNLVEWSGSPDLSRASPGQSATTADNLSAKWDFRKGSGSPAPLREWSESLGSAGGL